MSHAKKKAVEVVIDTDDSESRSSYEGFDEPTKKRVRRLASDLLEAEAHANSHKSTANGNSRLSFGDVPGVSPFGGDKADPETLDARLDPTSDRFESKYWVKNLRKLMDSDPDYYKRTSLSVAYKNLRSYGLASDADYQSTVANVPMKLASQAWNSVFSRNDASRNIDILKPMSGLIPTGTVTVVLGRPGAGCTTFLKTIASHTHGFHVGKESVLSYSGLSPKKIKDNFRGEVTYSAETDVHFPQLTVKQTLEFAAALRVPHNRPDGVSRDDYISHITEVYMATYGLSHTRNTQVGNEFVRGVSGGERKRVSIAEVSLCGSYLQCWDNATRGLDSATALEFIKALRTSADVLDVTSLIAIYQCSQDAYDLFDNTILLYQGYQIYCGPAKKARDYFERMGYECPARQTTADYLTSLTNPAERIVMKGYEDKVPRTPKEFYDYWNASPERLAMEAAVDQYVTEHDEHAANAIPQQFSEAHVARQSGNISSKSPYRVSYGMQIRVLMRRNYQRIRANPSILIMMIFGNTVMSLILSSLFFNLPNDTSSFYNRGAAMFFTVLYNCFASMLEILGLFESRPIVEKHRQYALHYPSAEALASIFRYEYPSHCCP